MGITLSDTQRGALLAAVAQPGWAVTLDAIADGCDAIRWLRAVTPGSAADVPAPVSSALKAASLAAVAKGFFGPGEEVLALLTIIGLPIRQPS